MWQAWQSRQARILAGLSAEERAGLAAGLRGLVRGLAAEGLLEDAATPAAPARAGGGSRGARDPPVHRNPVRPVGEAEPSAPAMLRGFSEGLAVPQGLAVSGMG